MAPLHPARTGTGDETDRLHRGACLIDEDGAHILNAISSRWVITHGHRHAAIMAAIERAAETCDQVIFAEYTHAPAEEWPGVRSRSRLPA